MLSLLQTLVGHKLIEAFTYFFFVDVYRVDIHKNKLISRITTFKAFEFLLILLLLALLIKGLLL